LIDSLASTPGLHENIVYNVPDDVGTEGSVFVDAVEYNIDCSSPILNMTVNEGRVTLNVDFRLHGELVEYSFGLDIPFGE